MNLFIHLINHLKPFTMNCSPTISIALMLISLTAGMWLLYKTKKESLGTLFKLVGWFIVIVSLGCIICCGIRCVLCKKQTCGTEQCGMGGKECSSGKTMHCKMKGEECCSEGRGEEMACCEQEREGCETEIEVKKDTIIEKE